jgi:hypothetical protein
MQQLMRAMRTLGARLKPETDDSLLERLRDLEAQLCTNLRRPSDMELREGIRHAVTPLFLAVFAS